MRGLPERQRGPQQLSVQAEATLLLGRDARGFLLLREGQRRSLHVPCWPRPSPGPGSLCHPSLLKKPTPRPRHTEERTFAPSFPRGHERIGWDPIGVHWKACEVAQSNLQMSSLRRGRTEPSSPNRKHLVQTISLPPRGGPWEDVGRLWDQRNSLQSWELGTRGLPATHTAFPMLVMPLPGG